MVPALFPVHVVQHCGLFKSKLVIVRHSSLWCALWCALLLPNEAKLSKNGIVMNYTLGYFQDLH